MTELQVILDFACCCCGRDVSATVKCAGKGLAAGLRTVAAVNIPCPNCGNINQLSFEPSGAIREVKPYKTRSRSLEPSVN